MKNRSSFSSESLLGRIEREGNGPGLFHTLPPRLLAITSSPPPLYSLYESITLGLTKWWWFLCTTIYCLVVLFFSFSFWIKFPPTFLIARCFITINDEEPFIALVCFYRTSASLFDVYKQEDPNSITYWIALCVWKKRTGFFFLFLARWMRRNRQIWLVSIRPNSQPTIMQAAEGTEIGKPHWENHCRTLPHW